MRRMKIVIALLIMLGLSSYAFAVEPVDREDQRKDNMQELQKKFEWWPTDATPGPVKDEQKGGYWWMPKTPGEMRPWGNRGYIYVYKIIFDYKEEELPPPKKAELRPSLLIKKIMKNVKVYFDYDKADLRDDAKDILADAARAMKKNPEMSILITGNCDIRGTEQYNEKLGRKRADSVKQYMLDNGVTEDRIKIVSRGKLDAIAHVKDLVGMQKDRNAQFMIAQVEEVMMPYQGEEQEAPAEIKEATKVEEGKFVLEKEEIVESAPKIETKEYVTKKDDSLWKIALQYYGNGNKWKNIYEYNKDRIKDPNKLKPGTKLVIPIE